MEQIDDLKLRQSLHASLIAMLFAICERGRPNSLAAISTLLETVSSEISSKMEEISSAEGATPEYSREIGEVIRDEASSIKELATACLRLLNTPPEEPDTAEHPCAD